MTCVLRGPRTWSMDRDEDGHRTYKITFLVASDTTDGPANVVRTPGLPIPGSYWNFYGDTDPWATCKWDASVKRHQEKEGEVGKHWLVEMTFSTKPPKRYCKENQVEDPILEPPHIEIGTNIKTEEAYVDRFGLPVVNSAWEQLRGAAVEFDTGRPTVSVTQNVLSFEQAVLIPEAMQFHLNNTTLWGYAPGTILLRSVTAEIKWYGQCYKYYTRKLEFDLSAVGFHRDILDEGTKVLNGHWGTNGQWVLDPIDRLTPNPNNPAHFIKFTDRQGNNCRGILNGHGVPAYVVTGTGKRFMSIKDSNIGRSISDLDWWIPLPQTNSGDPVLDNAAEALHQISPDEWEEDVFYDESDLVRDTLVVNLPAPLGVSNQRLYVCLTDATIGTNPRDDPGNWRMLQENSSPGTPFTYNLAGYYTSGTTYNKMDVVYDTGSTSAGIIRIERYPYANFLLLGLPLVL